MRKKFACLDNPEQNNWRKLKNPSKFRQGKKSVISTFVFLTAIAKVRFLEGRLGTRLSLFLIYIFIQFWEWLFTFSMLFAEAPASCDQKFLKWFVLHCTLICMSSKSVSHICKIIFQTEDINIFVLCGIFFRRHVQLKSSFSNKWKKQNKTKTKKKTEVKSEIHFREATKV